MQCIDDYLFCIVPADTCYTVPVTILIYYLYNQVFMTGDGRGWGVRALDEIPKGTFVCEYVGEILTVKELQERYCQSKVNLRNSQPVLLDANWAPHSGLKDEEAFCLDATFYGNVARFLNHRYGT